MIDASVLVVGGGAIGGITAAKLTESTSGASSCWTRTTRTSSGCATRA